MIFSCLLQPRISGFARDAWRGVVCSTKQGQGFPWAVKEEEVVFADPGEGIYWPPNAAGHEEPEDKGLQRLPAAVRPPGGGPSPELHLPGTLISSNSSLRNRER